VQLWGIDGPGNIPVGFVIVLTAVLLFTGLGRRTLSKVGNQTYEGGVIDKWGGFHEGKYGSVPFYRVLIEKKSGERIQAVISSDEYQRVRVGMIATRNGAQLQFREAPRSVSGVNATNF